MSFYGALFVWLVIAGLMVTAVVLAFKLSILIPVIALVVFAFLFARYGCLLH